MQKLSLKQARFVDEYLVDFNGAGAAKRAGYSERAAKETASRLLTYVNVADAVSKGAERASERLRISRNDVIDGLMMAVAAAQNTMDLVAAWREIGKIIGAYPSNRIQVQAEIKPQADYTDEQFRRMSTAQLLEIIGGDEAEELKACLSTEPT